jgi:hypothetical protein
LNKNIEKLQAATALVAFDNTLRGAANTVAYYGAIFLLLGIVFTLRFGVTSGWTGLAIGAAILGESFYIRRSRSQRALWTSGISFAIFAVWLLGSAAYGFAKNDPSLGKAAIAGAFLGLGAWNILRSYSTYKRLLETSDPAVNNYVRDCLEQMRTAKLPDSDQIVEFKKRGVSEKGVWRLQPADDYLLVCHFGEKTFGFGGRPQEAAYVSRREVHIQDEGARWIGKDVNATLSISGAETKIQLKPEMLARFESVLACAPRATSSVAGGVANASWLTGASAN